MLLLLTLLKPESIKSLMLSPCINKYIDNPKIKTLATASTWLGNDETHYVRKHEDYNIEHLKVFISSVAAFIESDPCLRKSNSSTQCPEIIDSFIALISCSTRGAHASRSISAKKFPSKSQY